MDRRSFLRSIALGSVLAGSPVALGSLEAQASGGDVAPAGTMYPGTVYVEGTVLSRKDDRLLLGHPELGMQEVVLSARTSVWKEVDTTAQVINVGDFLSLRGYPLAGGTVDALVIWVNIGWHRGRIARTGGPMITVETGDGEQLVQLTELTILYDGEQPRRFEGQLAAGQLVEALGAFDRPGGILRASRVWVS